MKMGWVIPGTARSQKLAGPVNRVFKAADSHPEVPVILILGKSLALASPILALAATRDCSARMSGRRSRRAEVKPGGTVTVNFCSRRDLPRGMGPGLRPRRILIWFSFCSMARCRSGTTARAPVDEVCGHDHRGSAIITNVISVCHQFEGIFPVFHGAVADFELLVQGPELDVSPGHVGHQGLDDEFAVLLRGEDSARGLRKPADTAEKSISQERSPAMKPAVRSNRGTNGRTPRIEVRMLSIPPSAPTEGKR